MVTDSQGNVISRRDFKPFGEEITNNTGGRTTAAKYGVADNLRQKFTTYQRDEESGLDFAEARMYENRHGRFTAVDPLLASGKSANPQTFNRFVYVLNNPLILMDPEGLQAGRASISTRSETERQFTWRRPVAARRIGEYGLYKFNISSIAGRFSYNMGFRGSEGDVREINAIRHVLWQAIITKEFGAEIAKEAGDAHEGMGVKTGDSRFKSLDEADRAVDTLNNQIGRTIGEQNSDQSNKALAQKVLEHYSSVGLYVATKNDDGTYTVERRKISAEEMNKARKAIGDRDDDGFTPKGRLEAETRNLQGTDQIVDPNRGLRKIYEEEEEDR